jgi:hypothetical protein
VKYVEGKTMRRIEYLEKEYFGEYSQGISERTPRAKATPGGRAEPEAPVEDTKRATAPAPSSNDGGPNSTLKAKFDAFGKHMEGKTQRRIELLAK